jgi:hypothetical protein
LSYLAIADGEATGRVQFEMTEVRRFDSFTEMYADGWKLSECSSHVVPLPQRMTIKETAVLTLRVLKADLVPYVVSLSMRKMVNI